MTEALKAMTQQASFAFSLPARARTYPQLRYMGSKFRLLPWIHEALAELEFDSALDAFSGSGCVSYLIKCMGKRVTANDFLNFSRVIAAATVENPGITLSRRDTERILSYDPRHRHFIERTFKGIFYTPAELRFLDRASWHIHRMRNKYKRAIAMSGLVRSCVKRQPRGVFTVAGDPARYKDGRRDLLLSLEEHFLEQVDVYNRAVFDNGLQNQAHKGDVFDVDPAGFDLVYMDPPYVPRSDDNCYVKRYHFLEGLSSYWKNLEILETSRVKKLKKRYTPFSYRKSALEAFDKMFSRFSDSTLVLSYSSNGYPDLAVLIDLMKRYKSRVRVLEKSHRYHFGTHAAAGRNSVQEYLLIGQ